MSTKFEKEVVDQIKELYEEGFKYSEIAELVGVTPKAVSNQVTRLGISNRKKCERTVKIKKCPKCNKKLPHESKFCMFCGADVTSKEDVLLNKLETVFKATQFIPETVRNDCVNILREVRDYLVEAGEKHD